MTLSVQLMMRLGGLLITCTWLSSSVTGTTLGDDGPTEISLVPGEVLRVAFAEDSPQSVVFSFDRGDGETAHLWAWSVDLEPSLTVELPDGRLLERGHHSGGPGAAYLPLTEGPAGLCQVTVGAGKTPTSATIDIHLAFERDTVQATAEQAEIYPTLEQVFASELPLSTALDQLNGLDALRHSTFLPSVLEFLGALADRQEDLAAKLEVARRTVARCQRILPPNHQELRDGAQKMMVAAFSSGDIASARDAAQAVFDALHPSQERERVSMRHNVAQLNNDLGYYDRARELYAENFQWLEQPDRPSWAWLLLQQTRVHWADTLARIGHIDRATELLRDGLGELSDAHNPPGSAAALELLSGRMVLAKVLSDGGQLHEAHHLQEALAAELSALGPSAARDLAVIQVDLARSLCSLGKLAPARALAERALQDLLELHHEAHPDVLAARRVLGWVLGMLGDTEASWLQLDLACKSALLQEQASDALGLLAGLQDLAKICHELGRTDRAKELLDDAARRWKHSARAPPLWLAFLDRERGQLLAEAGRHKEALALQSTALERFVMLGPDSLWVQQAQVDLASTLAHLGRYDEALAAADEALAHFESGPTALHPVVRRGLETRSWALLHLGKTEAAVASARTLVAHLTETVQIASAVLAPRELASTTASLAGQVSTVVRLALLCDDSPAGAALTREVCVLAERVRSVDLSASRRTQGSSDDDQVTVLRNQWRLHSATLAAMSKNSTGSFDRASWEQTLRNRDAVQRRLVQQLSGLVSPSPVNEAEQFAAALPRGTAALGFLRITPRDPQAKEQGQGSGGDRLVASLFVNQEPPRLIDLGPLAHIEAAVHCWRAAILGSGPGDESCPSPSARLAGEALLSLVLQPVLAAAHEPARLIMASDDVLHLINWEALPDGDDLLGERLPISQRPALMFLAEQAESATPTGGLLALGAIDYDSALGVSAPGVSSSTFAALPGTGDEVKTVSKLYSQKNADGAVTVLTGSNVTGSRLAEQAPTARFVHLATHGYSAANSVDQRTSPWSREGSHEPVEKAHDLAQLTPLVLSGLALSGANLHGAETAGVITGEELASLDFRACELAVLSACGTSVGPQRAWRGVASLQRALHLAGARQVVASLWEVDDQATQTFMAVFYEHLWEEGLPAGEALRQTRRSLREAGEFPEDWAGWVLSETGP